MKPGETLYDNIAVDYIMVFQSTPGNEAGRNGDEAGDKDHQEKFQSTPGNEAGRNLEAGMMPIFS